MGIAACSNEKNKCQIQPLSSISARIEVRGINRTSIFISDVDSHDWMKKGPEYELNQVLNHKHLGNGSIVLFHNDAKDTPKVLDAIIKGIKAKGYEIVPISELIHKENYYMDHEGRQKIKTTS